MSGTKKTEQSNVVPLRPSQATRRRSEAKWGAHVMKIGFCIVPALLLRAQRRLGLGEARPSSTSDAAVAAKDERAKPARNLGGRATYTSAIGPARLRVTISYPIQYAAALICIDG